VKSISQPQQNGQAAVKSAAVSSQAAASNPASTAGNAKVQ
jgi:hypothetical protein